MSLQIALPEISRGAAQAAVHGFRAADVTLRHLKGKEAVDAVRHMREENIDLSIHSAARPNEFETLEKKETNAVSCSVSSSMAN